MEEYQLDRSRQMLHFQGQTCTAANISEAVFGSDEMEQSLKHFLEEWFSPSDTLQVQTSGSTGAPKKRTVKKAEMMASATATCDYFHLHEGQKAYLCMNLKYIGAQMMVVRSLVAGMELVISPTVSGRPFASLEEEIDFAAIVPLQLFNSLKEDLGKFKKIRTIIVGGGSIDESLLAPLQQLDTAIYSTYGMTETLSHIALRRLNGPEATLSYFPLEGIRLTQEGDGRLVIEAPHLTSQRLRTNDLVELKQDGSFIIKGRADNVIVTGGIKIQIEQVENKLETLIPQRFAITAIKDEKFGEKIILLLESSQKDIDYLNRISEILKIHLEKYERPKGILLIEKIPVTENGKIRRLTCRELAEQDKNLIFVLS